MTQIESDDQGMHSVLHISYHVHAEDHLRTQLTCMDIHDTRA